MSETSYDRRTIWFHWLSAGLVAVMYLLAQIIDEFGRTYRVWPRSLHILLGIALMLVLAARLIWRNTGSRTLPSIDKGAVKYLSKAVHIGLYGLLAAALLLGLFYELARADDLFTLGRLPSIAPGDRALRHQLEELHGTAANLLMILAGLHAAAALVHHYILRDATLRRMLG
jgi:cytochrome b561